MSKKNKGREFYFWINGGTGHKKEFCIKESSDEKAFSQFIKIINDVWKYDERDVKRWLDGKSKNKD